jgi:hypothetical protein
VNGKIENGQAKVSEISVQEGKETKKYTKLNEVPAQHRLVIQQMLLPSSNNFLTLPIPLIPNFSGRPGLEND